MKSFVLLASCFAAVSLAVANAHAQTPQRIPDQVSCAACRITTSSPVFLRVPTQHALSSSPQQVRADTQGRIVLLDGASVLVFDNAGRFVQSIGREGRGPNEYQGPGEVLVLPGDSLLIIDPQNTRATVISPDLRHVRGISYPNRFGIGSVIRWPDSVLISGFSYSPRVTADPLYLMSFRGNSAQNVRTFGSVGGALRPGYPRDVTQHINVTGRAGTITVDRRAYDITVWSRLAAERKQFERRPAWFAQPSTAGLSPKAPPPPAISGTWFDSSTGLLWVVANVPAPGWASAWSGVPAAQEIRVSAIAVERLYNSVLEVVDLAAGRVVTRTEINGWVTGILPGGRLVKYSVDLAGEPRIGIVDAKLIGR
jgi:hypothetical protein